jgi:hypothetical protein
MVELSCVLLCLAVNTITRFLRLDGVTPGEVFDWYTNISDAIVSVTRDELIPETCRSAVAEISERVAATIERGADALLRDAQAHGGLRDDELGPATIVLMFGANRDGDVFDDPDTFRLGRANIRQHVTFVQGPHACIGLHLARLETVAAVNAVLDGCPDLVLGTEASTAPSGLIFRKPDRLVASWAPTTREP